MANRSRPTKPSSEWPRSISVAICTYNRYDLLEKTVSSVINQAGLSIPFEVVIVDNAAHPDTERGQTLSRRSKVIRWMHEKTKGLSSARNRALAEAAGEVIVFLDDDAEASPDWLASCVECFRQFGERTAIVGGRVEPKWSAEPPHWLPRRLLDYYSIVDLGSQTRILEKHEWLAGTNIAFDVKFLRENNGFSTGLGRKGGDDILLGNEEIELIRVAQKTGRVVAYEPAMGVHHNIPASRLNQTWLRRRVVWQAISDYALDPKGEYVNSPDRWHDVQVYMSALPPEFRNPRGFHIMHTEPEPFERQIRALYGLVANALSGFESQEGF